jgi:hypothetical protein
VANQNEHRAAALMRVARRAQAVLLAGAPIPDRDADWEWQPMPTRFDLVGEPGGQPDLLVRSRQNPEHCLLFTLGMPASPGLRHWLAPGLRAPAHRVRSGRRRARAFQAVMGGRLWGGVVVDVRGYPELRTLQVAIAYRWTSLDEAAEAILARLVALRIRRGGDAEGDANYVTALLVRWAQQGEHLASLPLTRRYLVLLAKGDRLAERAHAALDEVPAPSGWPSSRDRFTDDHTAAGAEPPSGDTVAGPAVGSIRRLARQLRERDDGRRSAQEGPEGDGIARSAAERRLTELARAEAILAARAKLRRQRLATRAYLGEHPGSRAVERFFERHATDPDFEARLQAYVKKRATTPDLEEDSLEPAYGR